MKNANKLSQQDLDIINRVAYIYNFQVRFDGELDEWIIEGDRQYSCDNFYWDSSHTLEDFFSELIRCRTKGVYGVDEEVSITYEDAKQIIEALQTFVQAVDEKKRRQEAND